MQKAKGENAGYFRFQITTGYHDGKEDPDQVQGLSTTTTIVIIVVVVLLILLLVGLGVYFYAKQNKKWCFDDSSAKPGEESNVPLKSEQSAH